MALISPLRAYKQDTLEWDSGDGGYNVNIEGSSTYTSDHCRLALRARLSSRSTTPRLRPTTNNALTDIIFTGKGEFKSANVQVSDTKGTSYWNAAKEQ